uniref:Uncharacterized protein n=1 Tax=Anguilla anguilla TaxID=7936 RepID=A0A0E9R6Z3_ANGAN
MLLFLFVHCEKTSLTEENE